MADKRHMCLLGLIILCTLLTGISGVDDTQVFCSSGENVRLSCNNALSGCTSTTWSYNRPSETVELIVGGIKKTDRERHERLSLDSDCSLNIKKVTKEDRGLYSCRQYVNEQQQGTDARVFLHVLHASVDSTLIPVSSSNSEKKSRQTTAAASTKQEKQTTHTPETTSATQKENQTTHTPETTSDTQQVSLSVIWIAVAAALAVLITAVILWVIRRKRADKRKGTNDSVEQKDDVTYTEVVTHCKTRAKKNKVHDDDKVTYSSIRGATVRPQDDWS